MKKEHIQPILIKAGDTRLRLGELGRPPLFDCRVIAEEEYQLLLSAYKATPELLEALDNLRIAVGNNCDDFNRYLEEAYSDAVKTIKKATE